MNFRIFKSRLRNAIERGLASGKLREELRELGDLKLKSRSDAEDICWGLQKLNGGTANLTRQADALSCLFQDVEGRDCAAFEILQERGIPELLRLFDDISGAPNDDSKDTLLFILKVLGLYGTVTGTLKIVEAARRPLAPDAYMWNVVLGNFTGDHPEKDLLYTSLGDPLPDGFIAVSLLDAANAVLIGGDSMRHPFDSPAGSQRLREWLSSSDEDEFSYAHSATAALPFLSNPDRDTLIGLALKHKDPGVRIEAAWAAAKIGQSEGLLRLKEYCVDFKTAEVAKRYLSELGREDVIPIEANEPSFAALAEFSQWLSHPNELGRAPDELEIVDHRELPWPPERKVKPFWLIKYTTRDTTGLEEDDVGYGLVGSVTFCFFSYELAQRPPEDAYAAHCYWEMEQKGLIEGTDVRGEADDYRQLLDQWSGPSLEDPEILFVTEISPEVRYPQRLVGLASAQLNGEAGWVVLDGARSGWYPRCEQPLDVHERVVLNIHVGRHLLGITGKPDRKRFLAKPKPPRPAEQIIHAYEVLFHEAEQVGGDKKRDAFSSFGPIEKHLEQYVDALHRVGRIADIRSFLTTLAPRWEHASGFTKLGHAAFNVQQFDLAEQFLLKLREAYVNYERGEPMDMLAEIWCRNGKLEAARDLLLDCMRRLYEESKSAKGSDKALFEQWFQQKRRTFFNLFPENEPLLAAQSIPVSTVRQK